MLSWYAGIKYEDTRYTFDSWAKAKEAPDHGKKYKHNSLPTIFLPDGTQMIQMQSFMRFIATMSKGKKGETLYPGKKNAEACWQIDDLLETSIGLSGKFQIHMKPECTNLQVRDNAMKNWQN